MKVFIFITLIAVASTQAGSVGRSNDNSVVREYDLSLPNDKLVVVDYNLEAGDDNIIRVDKQSDIYDQVQVVDVVSNDDLIVVDNSGPLRSEVKVINYLPTVFDANAVPFKLPAYNPSRGPGLDSSMLRSDALRELPTVVENLPVSGDQVVVVDHIEA